jgi:hypothetical protein
VRFPRLQPGDRLSADLVNRMLDAIERLEGMTADASSGIELVRAAGGICLRLTNGGDAADDDQVVIRVTSTDPDDLSDGLYPAVIESCTDTDGDPPVWQDGDDCWAVDPNGNALTTQRYNGTAIGTHSDGTTVFSAQGIGVGYSAVVRVTSTTLTDSMYPCDVEAWADGTPPSWSDAATAGYVFPPNGETLAVQRYPAVLVGQHSDGMPVFTAAPSPGTAANPAVGQGAVVRVTSATPDETSRMYPAFVQTFTDGQPVAQGDGAACWAYGPNAGALTTGYYVAVYVLTHSDGNFVYFVAGTVIGGTCSSTNVNLTTA